MKPGTPLPASTSAQIRKMLPSKIHPLDIAIATGASMSTVWRMKRAMKEEGVL